MYLTGQMKTTQTRPTCSDVQLTMFIHSNFTDFGTILLRERRYHTGTP